ncbi:MAG: AI-2E family transporter [Propionibacteriaceae bacterium]
MAQQDRSAAERARAKKVAAEAIAHAEKLDHGPVEEVELNLSHGLSRILSILIALAAGWIAIQGIQEIKEIIAPVFLGLNLIIVAYPIKSWLARHGVPEIIGAVAAGFSVFLVLVGFFWSLFWAGEAFVTEMPRYTSKFNNLFDQVIGQLSRFGISTDKIEKALSGIDPTSLMGFAQTALSSLTGMASLLLVVATVLIFLMMDMVGFSGRMEIARKHNPSFVKALEDFTRGVRSYWVVSTVFGVIIAFLDWGMLTAMGVPLALVWGVLSFVTNYIPNIGFVIGLVPPMLMALLERGVGAAVVVLIGYSVLNFVVQSIIQPKIAGNAVGVTPTISFLSLLFWAWALGALGAILALPATLFCKAILIDIDPEVRWINAFIAAKPKTAGNPLRRSKTDATV